MDLLVISRLDNLNMVENYGNPINLNRNNL